jgi:tetratricopeptide (TPR) repeat protein
VIFLAELLRDLAEANDEEKNKAKAGAWQKVRKLTEARMPSKRFAFLILAFLGVVFYLNSLTYDFVWDDRFLILENPYIQDSRLLGEGLVSDFWANYQDPRRFRNYYRPVVTLSYFVDYALWGEDPTGYHAANILLHVANVVLFFLIGCVFLRSREAAFVAAAVFAVHPVHTESVTWISGRTDLLASVFVLASVRQYLEAGKKSVFTGLITSNVFFAFALLSKEVAIVLPVALLLHTLLLGPFDAKRLATYRKIVLTQFAIAIAYLFVRVSVLEMPLLMESRRPLWLLILNTPRILARYIMKLLAPLELHPHDPMIWVLPEGWLQIVSATALVLILVLGVGWLGKRDSNGYFGGAWIAVFLLPVLNAGTFTDVLVAERFLYIPSIGFCLVLGTAYEIASQRKAAVRWLRAVAAVVIVFLGLRVWTQNPVWQNNMVLFETMSQSSPHFPLPHLLAGEALQNAGDPGAALKRYQLAYSIEPNNCRTLHAIALAQLELGFQQRSATILDTGFDFVQKAIALCPEEDFLYHTLGEYYLRQQDVDQAVDSFRRAIEINPNKMNYYYNIGAVLHASGKQDDARPYLEKFVKIAPRGEYRDQALEWLTER